jgi:DNA polymerase IV
MILHIDMDAFFAAVEQRDNPLLRNKPVIVAGNSNRSVVSTASYEARQFGIHSAMPVFQARQRCAHLIIVPGNRQKYAAESKRIMGIISDFSPMVEQVSIDEAYVDINGCEKLFGPPRTMAQTIKRTIFKEIGLTCSIGIAPVKFLAKIASDMDKPNGITLLDKDEMDTFIKHLPIAKVPGVGKKAMKRMALLQIQTLADIQKYPPGLLTQKFGKMGNRLYELSQGKDSSRVECNYVRKSISSETTLTHDISDAQIAKQILLALSQRVGRDLRKRQMICRNVSIKLKFSDFTQITRSRKIESWSCSSTIIFNEALYLYKQLVLKQKIRLLGVGVSIFKNKNAPVQMDLLCPPQEQTKKQWESVDMAVDSIREKFGSDMVTKASLTPSTPKNTGKTDTRRKGMNTTCMNVTIKGRVQGVFFRAETQKKARSLNLTGYVKNLRDGSVEAFFQGDPDKVQQMIKWCHTGPPASKVLLVIPQDSALIPSDNFEIRY